MRMVIEAKPGRYIVAGRLTEEHPEAKTCTLTGELRYRGGSEKTARLRLLYREGQQLPGIGKQVIAKIMPGETMLEYLEEGYIKPDVLYGYARDVRPFGSSYHFRARGVLEEEHIFSGKIDIHSMAAESRNGRTVISFRLRDGKVTLAAYGKGIEKCLQTEAGIFVTGPKDRYGEYRIKKIR